ncbi:hypothetical protein [Phascolarctobacterium faecium]|uniref:hypothetical protein n=1 Tax=Phascolarctobacterium faecium TaxID=33025 RepID=UPI003A9015A5
MEIRTIRLVEARLFQLTLQPMNDSEYSYRIIAVADDYCKLVKWYQAQIVSDGRGVMRFKPGSPLEWFYPAASLELNRLDAYDRGISDEWVELSIYEDIFESKDYYVVR